MHGIDLEMRAHVHRAVRDAALQRAFGARVDVLGGEVLLRLGDFADRLFEVALLGLAAVEDVRLVEMDVRLDERRRDEPAAEIHRAAFCGELRLDRRDPAAIDADVECRAASGPRCARCAGPVPSHLLRCDAAICREFACDAPP